MGLLDEIRRQKAANAQTAPAQIALTNAMEKPVQQPETPAPSAAPVQYKPNPLDKFLVKKGNTNVVPSQSPVIPETVRPQSVDGSPSINGANGRSSEQPSADDITAALSGIVLSDTAPGTKAANPLDLLVKRPASGVVDAARKSIGIPKSQPQPVAVPVSPAPAHGGDTTGIPAPEVKIPENATEDQKLILTELKGHLEYLVQHIDQREVIAPVVRNIMMKLQANPDLCVFVPDTTWNSIVRGTRASYKFEARKAQEGKEKKTAKQSKAAELIGEFESMGFGNLG